ncbi:MAG: hypothetical protein ACP5CD_04400 [Thermovirgaceae bacterium]
MSADMTFQTIQHQRRTKAKTGVPICLGACIILTFLLTGLVGLRLYSLSLEYRLAHLQQQIVSREDVQDRLRQELARLVSPSRVFAKATNNLGMSSSPRVAVVRVKTGSEPMLARAKGAKDENTPADGEGSMLEEIMNLLTRKASARQ